MVESMPTSSCSKQYSTWEKLQFPPPNKRDCDNCANYDIDGFHCLESSQDPCTRSKEEMRPDYEDCMKIPPLQRSLKDQSLIRLYEEIAISGQPSKWEWNGE